MKKILCSVILAASVATAAFAQAPGVPAPVPPAGAAGAAASSTVSTEIKPGGVDIKEQNANRAPSTSPGRGTAPMLIRLQDGGIKMPKCAQESREGLECK